MYGERERESCTRSGKHVHVQRPIDAEKYSPLSMNIVVFDALLK